MVSLTTTLALVGVSAVAAQSKACRNITIPVSVNATNMMLNANAPYPQNQSQVIEFITEFVQIPQPMGATFTNGTFLNKENYNITATFCPSTNSSVGQSPLQILIHGIGFDKSYWDFTNETSYTTPVRAAGYDTLAIDRLGCGDSSKPDGRNQVQTATHVDIVRAITLMARNGSLPSVNVTYTETVHVGHSYGSIITNGLVGMYPDITDGIILTGYSTNATWVPQTFAAFNPKFANLDIPTRFGNTTNSYLNNTYLTWSDVYNNQLAFFKYPYYDQAVLVQDELNKQPVTYGEIVTLAGGYVPTNFSGAVMVVNGNNDFIFCGGNCTATGNPALGNIQDSSAALFPMAANFSSLSIPNTGHALQLHYSNQNTTATIVKYLKSLLL